MEDGLESGEDGGEDALEDFKDGGDEVCETFEYAGHSYGFVNLERLGFGCLFRCKVFVGRGEV